MLTATLPLVTVLVCLVVVDLFQLVFLVFAPATQAFFLAGFDLLELPQDDDDLDFEEYEDDVDFDFEPQDELVLNDVDL